MDLNLTSARRWRTAGRATGRAEHARRWGRRSGKIARLPVEVGTVVRLFSAHSLAEERASCSPYVVLVASVVGRNLQVMSKLIKRAHKGFTLVEIMIVVLI